MNILTWFVMGVGVCCLVAAVAIGIYAKFIGSYKE